MNGNESINIDSIVCYSSIDRFLDGCLTTIQFSMRVNKSISFLRVNSRSISISNFYFVLDPNQEEFPSIRLIRLNRIRLENIKIDLTLKKNHKMIQRIADAASALSSYLHKQKRRSEKERKRLSIELLMIINH